ncbi:MAG: hypothetical protein ACRDUV_17490 [Pseudonocardiaceae bacterium]
MDATDTDYAAVPVRPPGLRELRVDRVGFRDAATVAALTVLTGLPDPLRAQVLSVAARSPADVVLRLDDGSNGPEVRWGGVEQSDRKAAVLGPLLTQPGKILTSPAPPCPPWPDRRGTPARVGSSKPARIPGWGLSGHRAMLNHGVPALVMKPSPSSPAGLPSLW